MARQDLTSQSSTRRRRAPSAAPANLLLLLGFLLIAAGAAFVAAPHISPRVEKIADLVAQAGFEDGVLLLGGVTLFGLGLIGRLVASFAAHEPEPQADPVEAELRVFNEQVTAKLAQLRTSVLQVSEELNALNAGQQALFQRQATASDTPDHQQDALFRLAASLDKLNAHLDERIHGIDLLLRSGLDSLAQVVQESRRFLELRFGNPAGPAAPPESDMHVLVDLQEQPQPQAQEGSLDFFETLERLDAMAEARGRAPNPAPRGRPAQPQSPFPAPPGESLDVLLPEDYRRGQDERY